MRGFKGNSVLVTGGASGIGQAPLPSARCRGRSTLPALRSDRSVERERPKRWLMRYSFWLPTIPPS